MILGSCNVENNYNGSFLSKNDFYKLVEYFQLNGGDMIDTACNYRSQKIIGEMKWQGKIITKVLIKDEIDKCFDDLNTDKIYCLLLRDVNNKEAFNYAKKLQKDGLIEKIGYSIYYQHELMQNSNVLQIPCNQLFLLNIKTIVLHADIFIRSLYNYESKKNIDQARLLFDAFKQYERLDLNHRILPVIGISNIEQLKENLRIFNE